MMKLLINKIVCELKSRPVFIVILFITIYAVYFSFFTVLKHQTYHSFAYDLGIFTQYMWTTLNGYGLFYCPIIESTVWAWHFQPILFLILPIYAIYQHPETLLVLQSIIIPLGALPVYWIAKDELGTKAGLIFAAVYLLYPALHGVNTFDFHPVAFCIPLLLFCFHMFRKKRYMWGILFAVLALMCKENVSLVVIFMGFYWLWVARKNDKGVLLLKKFPKEKEVIYPLILCALGIICFILAFYIIIPHFSLTGEYPYFSRYDSLWANISNNLYGKTEYLFYLFAPLLFTSLLYPPVLFIALPILAQNLISASCDQSSIIYHYSALIIPWMFISSIYGVKWLSIIKGKVLDILHVRFSYLILISTFVMALLFSPSTIAIGYHISITETHKNVLEQAISLIPEDASVYTQNDRFTHVCQRINAYSDLPSSDLDIFRFYNGNYDYILIDDSSEQSLYNYASEESISRLEEEYRLYAYGDNVYLYRRGYEGKTISLE